MSLEPRPGETLRAALGRTLRDAIREGALREGVRLPSSRTLALSLGVSRGVVSDAYGQLEAQGFLVTRARAAPVVAGVERPASTPRAPEHPAPAPRHDLTPTTPDVTLFPLARWLAAAQHVARRASAATLDYREPRGERALREALADHLGRTRGVIAEPEQIVVVQGTAQGVDLLLRILQARGARRVAVEDPSHTTQHERIRRFGFELAAQPVDDHGLVVDGLDAAAVLVTPAHQFPTGVVLAPERRARILAWAEDTDAVVIEDDFDSEYRYDRPPVGSLQGLMPERVVYCGTASKTLAPTLRLGWIVAPGALVWPLVEQVMYTLISPPRLEQRAFADFLVRGELDRHLRRMRLRYRRRRDALVRELGRQLPELEVRGLAAGLYVEAVLPDGTDEKRVLEEARARGIALSGMAEHCAEATREPALLLGYAMAPEPALRRAVAVLAEAVRAAA